MARSDVQMRNLARVLARFDRLPKAQVAAAEVGVAEEAEAFAAAAKRNAPNDPQTGGNRIAAGVEVYDNPSRPASKRIISGARDEDGTFIAPKVEYGHRNADGSQTPAHPTWWPLWRLMRKAIRRRMQARSRKALKAEGW
jgi:hypothetical protein